jgi:hypothetical protein
MPRLDIGNDQRLGRSFELHKLAGDRRKHRSARNFSGCLRMVQQVCDGVHDLFKEPIARNSRCFRLIRELLELSVHLGDRCIGSPQFLDERSLVRCPRQLVRYEPNKRAMFFQDFGFVRKVERNCADHTARNDERSSQNRTKAKLASHVMPCVELRIGEQITNFHQLLPLHGKTAWTASNPHAQRANPCAMSCRPFMLRYRTKQLSIIAKSHDKRELRPEYGRDPIEGELVNILGTVGDEQRMSDLPDGQKFAQLTCCATRRDVQGRMGQRSKG